MHLARVVELEESWGTVVRLEMAPEDVPSLPALVGSSLRRRDVASGSKEFINELSVLLIEPYSALFE